MLKVNSEAPELNTEDALGNPVLLSAMKGKKVFLSFMRSTGCPICHLHVNELLQREEELEKNNIKVVFVFESTAKAMQKYIKNERLPFVFISDPDQVLYGLYEVEKSWLKFFKWAVSKKGMYNGILGYTKFHKYSPLQGSTDRVGAEFLIDENGVLEKVHYGKRVGDHMPLSFYL
jgi:thioredoxin-dependent peroxiredoxin